MADDFDYGDDWTGYDSGESGYSEPDNYVAPGSEEAWNNPEHYTYEPPTYSEGSNYEPPNYEPGVNIEDRRGGNLVEAISTGNPDKGEGKGGDNYNDLRRYGDNNKNDNPQDSLRNYSRGSGGSSGSDPSSLKRLVSSSQVSTMSKKFNRQLPTFDSSISLNMPSWEYDKVRRLRQFKANFGVASLRDAANRAMTLSRSSQTGYAARQSLRDALSGYGKGISGIMREADNEAVNEYSRDFTGQAQKAQQEYESKFRVANTMYQAALTAYLNDFSTDTTVNTFNNYGNV